MEFQAYMSLYNDKGLFGFIFTAFELDKASTMVEAFHEELQRIATNLSDEELSNAKRSLFTDICLGIDGTQPVADEVGQEIEVGGFNKNRLAVTCWYTTVEFTTPKPNTSSKTSPART